MNDVTKSAIRFESSPAEKLYVELLKDCLTASIYDESAWGIVEPNALRSTKEIKWTPLRPLRSFVIRLLRKRRLLLVRTRSFDLAKRASGSDWPLFGYTMVGKTRIDNLEHCIRDVIERRVPGDFIETGVWRGGSVMFMRAMLKLYGITDRTVWVADSFEGMPIPQDEFDGWDRSHVEHLRVSLEQVRQNFARFGLLDDQVQFLKGWFNDTLPRAPFQRLAILRLDGDLYHSTRDSLINLYDKVSYGGYVIVDDYNSWSGCRRAVDEFLAGRSAAPDIRRIDGDAVYWKIE